jgi:hypothetical protein
MSLFTGAAFAAVIVAAVTKPPAAVAAKTFRLDIIAVYSSLQRRRKSTAIYAVSLPLAILLSLQT